MIKKLILIIFFLFLVIPASAATKYAQQNGNWSDDIASTTWYDAESGGSAVDHPAEGDKAYINSSITITVDSNITVGDDSGDALLINGTLDWPSTVAADYTLIAKGDIHINVGGTLQIGTVANPIPSARTATVRLNYSASLADGKYKLENKGTVLLQGASKTYWKTTLNGNAAATQKDIVTAVSTSWAVGDELVIVATGAKGETERDTIASISTTTITMTSNLTNAHADGGTVANITRNIKFDSYDATYESYIDFDGTSLNVDWVEFENIGYNAYLKYGIELSQTSDFQHCVFDALYYSLYTTDGSVFIFKYNVFIDGEYKDIYQQSYLPGDSGSCLDTCLFTSGSRAIDVRGGFTITDNEFGDLGTAIYSRHSLLEISGGKIYGCDERAVSLDVGDVTLTNVTLNSPFANDALYYVYSSSGTLLFDNCAGSTHSGSNNAQGSYKHRVIIHKINQTANDHQEMQRYGNLGSATHYTVTARGGSGECMVFDPDSSTSSTKHIFWEFLIPVTNGTGFDLTYYAKLSAADGDSSCHISVDIKGCGISDLDNAAASLSEADWNQETITVAAPSETGFAKVTFKVWDTGTAVDVYVDDIAISAGGSVDFGTLENWYQGNPTSGITDASATGGGESSYGFVN